MEVLSKYYKSLKQASDYLDNVKQIYNRQVDAYNIFNERIDSLRGFEEENLCECSENLKKNKMSIVVQLFFVFLLDETLICLAAFLLSTVCSLGIPLFIPLIAGVFIFMLHSRKKIISLTDIRDMKRKVDEATVLLGESKKTSSLIELIKELEASIRDNEKFIEDFKKAIDEYMSLLLAQENKLLPYGSQVSLENEIPILEEGLKKLNLSYREEDEV